MTLSNKTLIPPPKYTFKIPIVPFSTLASSLIMPGQGQTPVIPASKPVK